MGCKKQPMDADNLEELKTKKEKLDQTVLADETKQPIATDRVEELKSERAVLDQTVFADETQAVRHEGVFIKLWDQLRNNDPYKVLNDFSFDNIILGEPAPKPSPEWEIKGIKFLSLNGTKKKLNVNEFRQLLNDLSEKGWKLKQSEWSKTIVTGDGFTSQGPAIAHFGLGKIKDISEVQIRWPTGEIQTLREPKINRYHQIEYKKTN